MTDLVIERSNVNDTMTITPQQAANALGVPLFDLVGALRTAAVERIDFVKGRLERARELGDDNVEDFDNYIAGARELLTAAVECEKAMQQMMRESLDEAE